MTMNRENYRNISSYKELRVARNENNKALEKLRCDVVRHGVELAESLSPKAWIDDLMHCLSPLQTICNLFFKK